MSAIKVFGFGSLINPDSLKVTVPDAFGFKPAYIKGYIRDFSVWDSTRLMSALDIRACVDGEARVNGVAFSINEERLKELLERESEYQTIETIAFEYIGNQEIGKCIVFSSCKYNGKYDFKSEAQKRYLEICIKGAKLYGGEFYNEFIRTTYIEGRRLDEITELMLLND